MRKKIGIRMIAISMALCLVVGILPDTMVSATSMQQSGQENSVGAKTIIPEQTLTPEEDTSKSAEKVGQSEISKNIPAPTATQAAEQPKKKTLQKSSKQVENKKEQTPLEEIKKITSEGVTKKNATKIADLKKKYINQNNVRKASSDIDLTNDYLSVAVGYSGKFTIGTTEGNLNYTTDNDKKLLFGHPDPDTSETLIMIDGNEYFFDADSVQTISNGNVVLATMNIDEKGIVITQKISFYTNTSTGRGDTVKISYSVNNISGMSHQVGIRIMLDTMLADNDAAPFKITGYGNVTKEKVLSGSEITQTYQVYDDLDAPTTMATGTLWLGKDRHPDKVQYCNWSDIKDSKWNHQVEDDGYLGDSAVGIYFNPVNIVAGGNTSVNTYYGTGIGLSGSSDASTPVEDMIEDDEFDIYVTNSRTGAAVSAATVEIPGIGSVSTNAMGAAKFKNIDKDMNGKILNTTIHHAKYQDRNIAVKIETGSCKAIPIKAKDDTQPFITSAVMNSVNKKYDGIDLFSSTVHFNSNASDIEATKTNTENVVIKAVSDIDNCVYQLISDGKVIMENETGEFTLKTLTNDDHGKTFTTNRLCDFTEGNKIYVQAISETGETSKKSLLGIKVSAPSSNGTTILSKIALTSSFDLSSDGGANKILDLLLGESKKNRFGMKELPLEVEVSDDGKLKVAYNKGKDVNWKSFKDDYEKAVVNRSSALKNLGGTTGSIGIGKAKAEVKVSGYGEGYKKNGIWNINLGIIGKVEGSSSYTNTFFLGWVPLYIKVGAGAEAPIELKASVIENSGISLKITEGKFEPAFNLFAELGAGISDVLSAGVQGKGTMTYSADFLRDYYTLKLKAAASLEVHAFLYSNNLNIAENTWTLYDSNRKNAKSTQAKAKEKALYDTDSFTITSRSYQSIKKAGAEQEKEWNKGVYIDAKPVMVKVEDNTYYRFWIHDIPSRTEVNRTAVVYSKYNKAEDSWTEPTVLVDNKTADYNCNVEVSGSDIYVAYQEAKKEYSDYAELKSQGSSAGIKKTIAESQVSLAKLDTATGKVQTIEGISNENGIGALSPRVSADGGNITVAWYENTENNIFGAENNGTNVGDNKICYTYVATGDSMTKGDVKSFTVGSNAITSLDLGKLDGKQQIAYVIDTDNQLTTVSDHEMYLATNLDKTASKMKVTKETENSAMDGSPIFAKIEGKDSLVWYEGNNYYYTSSNVADRKAVFEKGQIPSKTNNGYAVLEGNDSTAIVWMSSSSKSTQDKRYVSLYGTKLKNGTWSNAYEMVQLSQVEDPMVFSLSGYLEDGLSHVSYEVSKYEEGKLTISSLCGAKEKEETKVSIENIDYDPNEVVAGATINLKVTLKNTGTLIADQAQLYVGNAAFAMNDLALKQGETKEYTIPVTLSNSQDGHKYSVTVEKESENPEKEPFQILANYTDLSVTEGKRIITGNSEYHTFIIKNESKVSAEDVNFKIILDDQEKGAVAYDYSFTNALAPGESYTLLCQSDALEGATVAYERLTTSTDEIITQNNSGLVCVSVEVPDLIESHVLTVKSENDAAGTIENPKDFEQISEGFQKNCDTNEAVQVTAIPKSGYVFTGWKITGKGRVKDKYKATTTFYMSNEDTVLTATFATENHITGITLPDQEQKEMQLGETFVFSPILVPTNSSDHIVWNSNKKEVVSVDEDGMITAKAIGDAVITARSSYDDQVVANCRVTVAETKIERIRMVFPNISISGVGVEEQLRILKYPVNATDKVIYSSDHPEYVSVDEKGKITSVAPGTAKITAKSEKSGVSAECTVTVTNPLQGIYFDKTILNMLKNETCQVKYKENPINSTDNPSTDEIKWNTSDDSIVEVNPTDDHHSATVKAVGTGTANVSVSIRDTYHASFKVEVKQLIEGISLDESDVQMSTGTRKNLDYDLTPYDAEGELYWSTSDRNVATVDDGIVEAKNPGTAVITVTSDTGYSASCTVKVYQDEVRVNSLEEFQSSHKYENNLNKSWIYTDSRATALTVSFSKECMVEEDYDYIYLYDGAGLEIGKYTDDELAGKVIQVTGNTIKVVLKTDSSGRYYGFKVDSITPVYPSQTPPNIKPDIAPHQTNPSVKIDLSRADLQVADCTYTGNNLQPLVLVKMNGLVLRENQDYTISYINNRDAGVGTVNVTGIGAYTGTVKKDFAILQQKIQTKNVSGIYNVVFTGKSIKIKPVVKVNGKILKLNRDYTLSYSNNKKISKKAIVKITGKKNYTGVISKKFTIVKKSNAITAKNTKMKVTVTAAYTGKEVKPVIQVKRNGKVFAAKNYIVVYSNNKEIGKATVRIYGKGTYGGSISTSFVIVPKTVQLSSARSVKKQMATITYKKVRGAKGYQIYIAAKKNGKYRIAGTTFKVSYTINKLKSKSTYYVKVRGYKKVGKKVYYSTYSKSKKVKVK
ncbi:hypothetical protein lbkm_2728 [Lachnospiraceae bacterium KM106-2]|nr:hypothetical protein lbkm_2728 [Lachnospiraceae bacterium KM106-2]